jgi:hypothetical protein
MSCFEFKHASEPLLQPICSDDNVRGFHNKLATNNKFFRETHKALYLGDGKVHGFQDPRLYVSNWLRAAARAAQQAHKKSVCLAEGHARAPHAVFLKRLHT